MHCCYFTELPWHNFAWFDRPGIWYWYWSCLHTRDTLFQKYCCKVFFFISTLSQSQKIDGNSRLFWVWVSNPTRLFFLLTINCAQYAHLITMQSNLIFLGKVQRNWIFHKMFMAFLEHMSFEKKVIKNHSQNCKVFSDWHPYCPHF